MPIEPAANPVGRPTKYDPAFHPVWVEKLGKLGATDEEIAEAFEVSLRTIHEWSTVHTEFLHARKKGKIFADAEVASKLFHRATGYQHEETDVKVIEGQVVLTDVVKHYAPDTTAAIFWLKNRQPAKWRDRPPELGVPTATGQDRPQEYRIAPDEPVPDEPIL